MSLAKKTNLYLGDKNWKKYWYYLLKYTRNFLPKQEWKTVDFIQHVLSTHWKL
jgi:hypothetical protein